MKAWQIFRHSVRQVTGNLPDALRLSLVPMAVQVVVMLGLIWVASQTGGVPDAAAPEAGFVLGTILAVIVMLATALWIAVEWHRYVLLNERPMGFVPPFHGSRIVAYLLRSLAYLLILAVVAALLMIVQTTLSKLLAIATPLPFMLLSLIVVLLPVLVLGLRLSAGLPGAAIGAEEDFTAGWRATADATADIVQLALILIGAQFGLQLVSAGLAQANLSILSFAWEIVSGWLVTMVGVSVLTTLYGHYVEGRPLV